MKKQFTQTALLAIASFFFVLVAEAGESLEFDSVSVETEKQDLNEVRELRKIRAEIAEHTSKLYVVQFNGPIELSDRQNLETLKTQVVSYIPDDAVVVRASPKEAQTIRMSSPSVRVVLPYEPSWKISSELPLPSVLTKDQVVDANVKFSSEKDANRSLSRVQSLKETEIVSMASDIVTLRTSPENLAPLSKLETVVWIASVVETTEANEIDPELMKEVSEYMIEERQLEAPSSALIEAAIRHSNRDTLNLSKALVIDELEGVSTGEQHAYPINVEQHGKLTVTLLYTDKESSPVAINPLANDLDVVVVDALGNERVLGDRSHPHEHVEFGASPGAYEIRIKGVNVPAGKQPYALLISVL